MPTLAELLGMGTRPDQPMVQTQNPNLMRILAAARGRITRPMRREEMEAEAAKRAAAQFMGVRG